MLDLRQKRKVPTPMMLEEPWEVHRVVEEYLSIFEYNKSRGDQFPLVVGLDTETTGLHLIKDRVSIYSFFTPHPLNIPELGIYNEAVAFAAPGGTVGCQDVLEAIRPIAEHPEIIKCGANISGYDSFMFRNHGIRLLDPIHDTIVMDWLHNENRSGQHGLKQTMWSYYQFKLPDYKTSGSGEMDIRLWPYDIALRYSALDAWASYKVWEFLQIRLSQYELDGSNISAWELYSEFFVPIQKVLREMMSRGVQVDMPFLDSLAPEIQQEISQIERWFQREWTYLQEKKQTFYITKSEREEDEARVARGLPAKVTGIRLINLDSHLQLKYLFFDLLETKVLEYGKPGKTTGLRAPSLRKEVLQEYASGEGPESIFAEKLLQYRALSKLYNTYIGDEPDAEEDYSSQGDTKGLRGKVLHNRVYTNFKFGPVTGRLASSGPNLMNIPARTDLGKKVRQAFIAKPGCLLVVADYAQLEMRLFAHFAEEPRMIQAILDGRDLHCWTASLMYDVPYDDIMTAKLIDDQEWQRLESEYGITDQSLSAIQKEYMSLRTAAKTIGFGLLYGMGPYKLSQSLNIGYEKSKDYIEKFFKAYPGVRKWIDDVHRECLETHTVWTFMGRPRRLQEIKSKEKWVRARAKRQSVNAIIQGSAADVVLNAMLRVSSDKKLTSLSCNLLLQVHDELVFEVPEDFAVVAKERVAHLMEYRDDFRVPLPVSAHIGHNWRDAK